MKIRQIMSSPAISVGEGETVEAAARTLAQYNIGVLPVCNTRGEVCGLVTDRDLVTRCMAAGKAPGKTTLKEIMTGQVTSVRPDTEIGVAAHLMGRLQVRRLPVVENGKLCGMVSLGDLAVRDETAVDASDALTDISSNLSAR
ncbi:MAG: CBS domain-containing protein [Oscillospiraceae bacterium]|nr:CBS domain-containing protein [Oscillospiraceae bacterium]